MAAVMAGLMMLSSIMGTRKGNKNAFRQQLQIVSDTETGYTNLSNQMDQSKRVVGMALTKNETKGLRDVAKHVVNRDASNVSGNSAFYAYTNFMQQKAFTKGTLVSKGEIAMVDYGKTADAKFAQARSGINQAEAKKKGVLEGVLDAVIAGGQGYQMKETGM